MTRLAQIVLSLTIAAAASVAQAAPSKETLTALGEIRALTDKVNSFRADLEVRDKQGPQEQVTTSTLLVSKQHGWKIKSSSDGAEYHFISDFTNFHQYFPSDKRAFKSVADNAEAQALFRKPVSDMNPLTLLDPATLQLKGKSQLGGEAVYHFEGTTSTQYLPQGKPVVRKMEAWISTKDGLPRRTVEQVGPAMGTTTYSNVQVNPSVTAQDFEFLPPPDVQVMDAKQQMELMQQEAARSIQPDRAPAGTPAPRPGVSEEMRP